MPEQFPQPGTAATVHPGLAKARDQCWRRVEEQHLMLPRRRQTMIQQHALGPIEAAAAEQMNDRQRGSRGGCGAQLRTQCRKLGTVQFLCGLLGSPFWSLITNSTGRPSSWLICAGCLKR